jgi:RimJ/RimL family protein N-acetyltransferase
LSDLVVPKNQQENDLLCAWAANKIGQSPFKNATALAFANSKEILAVIVLHDLSPPNVFLSWAANTPRWMTKGNIKVIHDWIFNQHKCTRVTGLVERNNKRARKVDEGLGMKLEGVIRKASPSGRDLMVYGLLKSEADALIARLYKKKNGQTISTESA